MSSLIGSHGVAIATAMAAVSGTVILLAVCRQKPLSASSAGDSPRSNLRSCIYSDERKREQRRSKKKKVRFAKDVVREFDVDISCSGDELEEEEEHEVSRKASLRSIPANRVALYHGMLQDRSRRMACSH